MGSQSSSTFVDTGKQFQVTYGSGEVSGDIVTDDVSIAGLDLKAHTFGVALVESVDFSADTTSTLSLLTPYAFSQSYVAWQRLMA